MKTDEKNEPCICSFLKKQQKMKVNEQTVLYYVCLIIIRTIA